MASTWSSMSTSLNMNKLKKLNPFDSTANATTNESNASSPSINNNSNASSSTATQQMANATATATASMANATAKMASVTTAWARNLGENLRVSSNTPSPAPVSPSSSSLSVASPQVGQNSSSPSTSPSVSPSNSSQNVPNSMNSSSGATNSPSPKNSNGHSNGNNSNSSNNVSNGNNVNNQSGNALNNSGSSALSSSLSTGNNSKKETLKGSIENNGLGVASPAFTTSLSPASLAEKKREESKREKNRKLLEDLLKEEEGKMEMLDELDITTIPVNFASMEEDMKNVQKNPQILQALKEGTDLKRYTSEVEEKLTLLERGTVGDYAAEGDAVAILYEQIISCDKVLEELEGLLTNFQTDIKNVGQEIKILQEGCKAHQVKLNNRSEVQNQLEKFIHNIHISEEMIDCLVNGQVNEMYQEYLLEFNRKVSFIETQKLIENDSHLKGVSDLDPVIKLIQDRSISKIKSYLSAYFYENFNDVNNISINHKILLRYARTYQYLFKMAPQATDEMKKTYQDTISRVFTTYFRNYASAMSRLTFKTADKNDLLGVEENRSISIFTGKRQIKDKASVFALGIRQKIVEQLQQSELIPEDSQEKRPYETLFKSMLNLLVEKVTGEITFTQDFFMEMDINMVQDMFSRVIQTLYENLREFVSNSYDSIAIFILIVIIDKYRSIMSKRLSSCLDNFFDDCHQDLMDRFFFVFDNNLMSVKNAIVKDLNSIDLQPHYVIRRYAEYNASLLYLIQIPQQTGDYPFVNKLNQNLSKLREEIERFLLRLAEAKYRDWRSRTMFLMNNYDLITSVLRERSLSSGDSQQIEKLLDMKLSDYIHDELSKPFARLLNFAKTNESFVLDVKNDEENAAEGADSATSTATPTGKVPVKEEEVKSLLEDFHKNRNAELQKIMDSIRKQFSNYSFGDRILERMIERLLESYSILHKIIFKFFPHLRKSPSCTALTQLKVDMENVLFPPTPSKNR
eukprot:TRINITY_DN7684_c0_g1_i1.p1 TRINITY_DN7684_c0_g1~~TRINITY_DN7684_c0_g1_i1.p1  ORF type:complete len:972 (+),score=390.64 TRINITY_DN7684_c0_g1_i1:90-3005(+)